MREDRPNSTATLKTTTRGTIAAHKKRDMERVFHLIEVADYAALDKFMLSGRAFHLPEGVEVYILDDSRSDSSMCKVRIKGSITEIWASHGAFVADPSI